MLPLALFVALLVVLSLHGLAASGHFPRRYRSTPFTSGAGPTILFASIAIAALSLFIGVAYAWRTIPWYAAILGGGAAVIVAPMILQRLPDPFVDGRSALIIFTGSGALLALTMISIAADRVPAP